MKPEDIAEDLWALTYELLYLAPDLDGQRANISRAIMAATAAERKGCAELAEDMAVVIPMWDRPGSPPGNGTMRFGTPTEIAAAIRKRGEP